VLIDLLEIRALAEDATLPPDAMSTTTSLGDTTDVFNIDVIKIDFY
jgi:hypothetical protein